MNLALNRTFFKFNILTGFKAIGIWPLNLERMQKKMRPSKPYYPISSVKVIVEEIMEEELPRAEEDGKHYFVEDEGNVHYKEGADPEKILSSSEFLKLPQREVQAPKIQHEPLVDYKY